MKLQKTVLLLIILILPLIAATEYPTRPQGPIGDFATIIDNDTKESVTRISQALWNQAGFALVIATVPSIGEESIEEYANELYKKWGIGAKDKDEGALIILSLDPRRARIEVGYGAEGYLNDAKTGRLLDMYALPFFKTGDYSNGISALVIGIAKIVESEKQIKLALQGSRFNNQSQPQKINLSPLQMLLIGIVLIVLLSTRAGRTLLFWMLVTGLSSSRRGGTGGFGGGFGSGGFGGGMSGGGGSSRSF